MLNALVCAHAADKQIGGSHMLIAELPGKDAVQPLRHFPGVVCAGHDGLPRHLDYRGADLTPVEPANDP